MLVATVRDFGYSGESVDDQNGCAAGARPQTPGFFEGMTPMSNWQQEIGNNSGRMTGWVTAISIFGKCLRVEA